ncbi:MAG: PAS domain S-box protein [Anaerolineae bacterium]|jgi:PAS domain S-box-containing protein|nr:PAS domain S-box protein [Anaerolineae bacterium]MBT7990466.1 PAS domain S-box protein [Anaerolineae bacterium]
MLGYEIDELLQKKSHQLYHHDFEEEKPANIDDCPIYQHTDFPKQAEEKTSFFYRKDGRSFPISYTNSPIMEEGNAVGVVMAFRDISKQVEARREIARLVQVVEQARISIGIMDLSGKGIYVNPFVEKTSGYKKEDFLGKDLKIPFDSAQDKEVYEGIWEKITTGKTWEGNLIHKKSDGSLYTEDANFFPVKDDENEIINYAFVKRDISAEVAANKALKEEKEFSETVIDTSTAIIVGLDKDHLVRLFNKGAERITGYSKEDVLGKDWFALVLKQEIAAEMNRVWKDAWGADAHAYINPIWIKNGEKRIISWQTTGFYENLPQKRQMLLSIGEDVTERMQAEEETKRTRDELARLYRASGALVAGTSPSLAELGRRIVETVLFEFEHSNCSLILADDNSLILQRVAVAGTYSKEVSQSTLAINGHGLVPEVIRKGIAINSPNVSLRKNYEPNWEAARSEMAVPLKVGEKTIGAIDVQSPEKNTFSADDQRLLLAFAERAALAIENIRLYEDAKRRLGRLGALHTIDVAIAKSVDNNQTVEVIAEQAQKELKVDAVSILVKSPSSQSFACLARRGFHTKALVYTNLAMGEGLAGQAASKRQIIRIDNLEEKSSFAKTPELANENFISYWGVPLISKGKVNGVLEIFHRKALLPNAEWESFLTTLAGQAAIAIDNASLFTDLQKSNQDLRLAYDSTLEGWSRALELRDMETEGHSRRVTKLTTKLATAMGIDSRKIEHINRGALLHDVGKMGIPDSILHKAGPLNDQEWAIMRQHTIYAYEMLKNIPFLVPALDIPRYHHEKWDGSGYPEGISGEAIPLPARIFAIIDVYDALTNVRPYREAWSKEKTLAHIKEGSGTHFDPKIVKAFTKIILEKNSGE